MARDNKYIVAKFEYNSISLAPRVDESNPSWTMVDVAKMMKVRAKDVEDINIGQTRYLSIEEAEQRVREINKYLKKIEKKQLSKAREAWVRRFNNNKHD